MKEKEYFDIEPSPWTRKSLAEGAPDLIEENVKVIILPSRPEHGAFFGGTLDLRDFLNDNDLDASIYSSDEDYKEVALHSATHWIGSFFVLSMALPVFLNLLSNYIFEKLKAKDSDTIEVSIVVEGAEGKSTSITYRGPAKNFEQVSRSAKNYSDA